MSAPDPADAPLPGTGNAGGGPSGEGAEHAPTPQLWRARAWKAGALSAIGVLAVSAAQTLALTRRGVIGETAPIDNITDALAWWAYGQGTWPIMGHLTISGPPHPGPGYVTLTAGGAELLGAALDGQYYLALIVVSALLASLGACLATAGVVTATRRWASAAAIAGGSAAALWSGLPISAVIPNVGLFLFSCTMVALAALMAAARSRPGFAMVAAVSGALVAHAYIAYVPLGIALIACALVLSWRHPPWALATGILSTVLLSPLLIRALLVPESLLAWLKPSSTHTVTIDERTGMAYPDGVLEPAADLPTALSDQLSLAALIVGATALIALAWRANPHRSIRAAMLTAGACSGVPLLNVTETIDRPWTWAPLVAVAAVAGAMSFRPREHAASQGRVGARQRSPLALAVGSALLLGAVTLGGAIRTEHYVPTTPTAAPGLGEALSAVATEGTTVALSLPAPTEDPWRSMITILQMTLETWRAGVDLCLVAPPLDPVNEAKLLSYSGPHPWCTQEQQRNAGLHAQLARGRAPASNQVIYQTPAGSAIEFFITAAPRN